MRFACLCQYFLVCSPVAGDIGAFAKTEGSAIWCADAPAGGFDDGHARRVVPGVVVEFDNCVKGSFG